MMSERPRRTLSDLPRCRLHFWTCPIDGHSNGDWSPKPVQTVEWRKNIAYCLTPGCARTSDAPLAGDTRTVVDDTRTVVDDGRVWWLLGAESWTGTHLYEARNARAALAEFRRDITAAEHANGLSFRDIRHLTKTAHLCVAAGPLTTVEAFQDDLATAYGYEIEHKTRDIIAIEVAYPATPMTAVDLAAQIDPARAAVIRADIRRRYLPVEVPPRPTEAEYDSLPVLDIDQLGT